VRKPKKLFRTWLLKRKKPILWRTGRHLKLGKGITEEVSNPHLNTFSNI
jgi:hypothetical protein